MKTRDDITIHPRSDWNARPPAGPYAKQPYIHSLVYHHGGPEGPPRMTDDAMIRTLQSWQSFHMGPQRGWTDIGYHWLMDGRGELWQGRPHWAVGAHVLMENTGRMGLCYVQDGREFGLTGGQAETTNKLFKRSHKGKLGLPGLYTFVRHPGDWGVFGHREVPHQSTECPGDKLLNDLHELIRRYD